MILSVSSFYGFCSQPTVDQPPGKQSTVDNGEWSVDVAVGVSDFIIYSLRINVCCTQEGTAI